MPEGKQRELLVVDGYNVIHATDRYERLVDAHTNPARLDTDPYVRAREALLSDVAAFAHGTYEPIIVYDAAGNPAPEHPELKSGGVRMLFSAAGQSADELIERLVRQALDEGRAVTLVTSDGTIRSTVGLGPGDVRCISSALLVREMEGDAAELERDRNTAVHTHLTLGDRLPPEQRDRLRQLFD